MLPLSRNDWAKDEDLSAFVADIIGSPITALAPPVVLRRPSANSSSTTTTTTGHESQASTRPQTAGLLAWPPKGHSNIPTSVNAHGNLNKSMKKSSSPHTFFTSSSITSDDSSSSLPEWQAQFFRTKMCPYVSRGPSGENSCPSGETCKFAHTLSELRPLPDLRKTKLCASYAKGITCKVPLCPFAHSPEELRTSSSVFYKVTLCNFYKNGKCWNGSNCRFAHGNGELRAGLSATASLRKQVNDEYLRGCLSSSSDKISDVTTAGAPHCEKKAFLQSHFSDEAASGRDDHRSNQRHRGGDECAKNDNSFLQALESYPCENRIAEDVPSASEYQRDEILRDSSSSSPPSGEDELVSALTTLVTAASENKNEDPVALLNALLQSLNGC